MTTPTPTQSPRVVSLIASATEIVCALGHQANLVGRSHECDYPPTIAHLPICTEPKFPVQGTSYEIDQRVKAILQEGLSVYRVFGDLLDQLAPDLIITQSQCEVCAVSLNDVEAAVCEMVHTRPAIVSLEPNALDDVWHDIRQVADALNIDGQPVVDALQRRIEAVAQRTRTLDKPTVACIEWIEPLMAAGNWMPELVERAGGRNLFGEAGKHSPWMTFEELAQADPDVIVILPCGWDRAQAREAMPPLSSQKAWPKLSAVQNRRVALTDGNQYFNRPGPRLAESTEILAEILHPKHCHYGHQNTAWEYL